MCVRTYMQALLLSDAECSFNFLSALGKWSSGQQVSCSEMLIVEQFMLPLIVRLLIPLEKSCISTKIIDVLHFLDNEVQF